MIDNATKSKVLRNALRNLKKEYRQLSQVSDILMGHI